MTNEQSDRTSASEYRDEVLDEVRAARQAYATRFDYDIGRMLADLTCKAEAHVDRYADLLPITPASPQRQ